jgi:ribosomal protein S18 acetylase RimI-like enzyme
VSGPYPGLPLRDAGGDFGRIVFLAVPPEYRRRGIGTALHHELKAHIPRAVALVDAYALLDSPVIPFLEKIGYLPGKQYLWMDRYA